MVTRQLQIERRIGSVHRPKTGVLPTVLRNQPRHYLDLVDIDDSVVKLDGLCLSVRRRR